MAHQSIFDAPGCVWTLIAQFADVTERQPGNNEELLAVGKGENDRRIASEAGALIVGTGHNWPTMQSSFDVETPVDARLLSRPEFTRAHGYVDHDVAQRASVLNAYLAMLDNHNQVFPMEVPLERDGEIIQVVIDPRPSLGEHMQVLLASFFSNVRGYPSVHPSPYRYRYHTRQIGDRDEVENALPEVRDIIVAKRRAMVHLRATLALLIFSEQITGTFAEEYDEWDESVENKYVALVQLFVGVLMIGWSAFISVLSVVANMFTLSWYWNMPPPLQAALDVLLVCLCVYGGALYLNREAPPLKVDKQKGQNIYLGQIATEKGIYHNVRVDGVDLRLPTSLEVSDCHQDEMAMPGSEYFPCKAQPIGAILVRTNDSDLRLFGVFWRMDEYLITARHCSNTLNQSTAIVYLASIKATKKGNFEVNRLKLYKTTDDFWSPERNAIAAYDVDAFAVELEEKTWSQIQITKASTRVKSAYNQQVHSVGFTPDGLLVSASGKTLPGSGFEHLHHTASTQKGFSGSIILCGNSVVGMHVSAAGEHNVAVRTEMIQYLIDVGTGLEANTKNRKRYTYADASYKEHYRQQKWRGAVTEVKMMRDGKFSIVLQNGEATYGWNMKELVDAFGTGHAAKDEDMFQDMLADSTFARKYGSSGGRDQYVDFDDDRYHRDAYENASLTSEQRSTKSRRRKRLSIKAPPPSSLPMPRQEDMSWLYTVESGYQPVHGPSAPKLQPEASQLIEDYKNEIVALGYVEGEFSYPLMTPQEERKSLEKHLKLFGETVKSCEKPPSEEEIERCANIVREMLAANTFVPDEDYDQISGIMNVINSTIIGTEKSAGYPYVEQGTPTNGQVLAAYGEKGFAQHVLNEWRSDFHIKIFEKGDPTKKKKIVNEMPRLIAGLPLHVTVKHASVFKNLSFSMVKNWKKSPVKYAFSPANPGHLEHMKEVLPNKVYESDKDTWDFRVLSYKKEIAMRVVQKLALRPKGWSDADFDLYLADVKLCFEQVFNKSKYRTSDGHVYTVQQDGIMKSGWFLTIVVNTIMQLIVHVLPMMRLGYSNDEILSYAIVAGGDDVNQDLEGVDLVKYINESQSLGVKAEIHVREDLEHSEFFSSDIRRGKDGLEYYPKRWTKHIEHLKTVKLENLPDALCSHMENYRHDAVKFKLLEDMFEKMRDLHPGVFKIEQRRSRQYLLAKQYGYEHAMIC